MYPYTGAEDPRCGELSSRVGERVEGKGLMLTDVTCDCCSRHPHVVNLPIEGRVTGQAFRSRLEAAIQALRDFEPDMIVVSLGFDAHRHDPIRDDNHKQRGFLG